MKRKKKKKKLEKKQKLFIFLGSFLLVAMGLGIYIDHQLDTFISSWSNVGTVIEETERNPQDTEGMDLGEMENPNGDHSWSFEGRSHETPAEEELPSFEEIARNVQARVDRPIEKTDMLRVGLILVRRLDRSEITYLYNVGKRGTYSGGEIQKTRRILDTKLTDDDMEVLQEMAEKYDQPLFFLD